MEKWRGSTEDSSSSRRCGSIAKGLTYYTTKEAEGKRKAGELEDDEEDEEEETVPELDGKTEHFCTGQHRQEQQENHQECCYALLRLNQNIYPHISGGLQCCFGRGHPTDQALQEGQLAAGTAPDEFLQVGWSSGYREDEGATAAAAASTAQTTRYLWATVLRL